MRTKIQHITLMPGVKMGDPHLKFTEDAVLLIEDSHIVYAGPAAQAIPFEADETIEGRGRVALPGLCNMHTHTPMMLMRSLGSDLALDRWLNEMVFPTEKHLTDDAVKAATELGILEMLRFGTTSFNDMYMRMDMEAEAVRDSGMRALLCYGVIDFDETCRDLQPGLDLIEKWQGAADGRVRIAIGPHSEATLTDKMLRKIKEAAVAYKVPLHMHVNETKKDFDGCIARHGMTAPQYLDSLGLLDEPFLAAHCVWMTDEDIDLFARKQVTILHNPVSNLKLASGVAPIARMLERGCRVTLGTDGVASNNNLNLWQEMFLMPLLQKGTLLDPTVVSPAQVFAAATSEAAKALQHEEDLGYLKPGYLADLILVDVDKCHMWPQHDLESNLLYAGQGSDVSLTMVAGKVLYQDGVYTTLDEKAVIARATREAEALLERAQRAKAAKQ